MFQVLQRRANPARTRLGPHTVPRCPSRHERSKRSWHSLGLRLSCDACDAASARSGVTHAARSGEGEVGPMPTREGRSSRGLATSPGQGSCMGLEDTTPSRSASCRMQRSRKKRCEPRESAPLSTILDESRSGSAQSRWRRRAQIWWATLGLNQQLPRCEGLGPGACEPRNPGWDLALDYRRSRTTRPLTRRSSTAMCAVAISSSE